jgi:dTDP-4-dehydrorhamnose 3,5-epimerase-like enzyme
VRGAVGIEECKLVSLPVVEDPQGDLAVAEVRRQVPFPAIARVYHVYGVPADAARGGHAHRAVHQMMVGVSGRVDVLVDDGSERRTIALEQPDRGLYLPPMIWHEMSGFSPGSSYFVLASAEYDDADYLRDYEEFRRLAHRSNGDR